MPAFLKTLYRGWMRFAHALGVVNTAILLTLVYVIGIGPMRFFGLIGRDDPLGYRLPGPSFWRKRRGLETAAATVPVLSERERQRLRMQF